MGAPVGGRGRARGSPRRRIRGSHRVDRVTFDLPGETGGHGEPALAGDDAPPWWEDDRGGGDEDEWGEFPRRRRSRVLQLTGVVVAAALVLGSVGGVVGVLLDDHSSMVLPTSDVTVARGDNGSHLVRITFKIENPTGAAVTPVCVVTVVYGGRDLGEPGEVQLPSLACRT
jgi:hypothetical protein